MNTRLAEAVERLYTTFAVYPLPKYTNPCLHCHSLEQDEKLRSKPLRELQLNELRSYAYDALLVWGDADVFKYFLPRIYELFVTLTDPSMEFVEAEILFSKFRHGQWHVWPKNEQEAVEFFLHAVWSEVLKNTPAIGSYMDVESWLCAIGQSEDDLSSYFEQWINDESQEACLALSALLLGSAVVLPDNRGRNAFWEDRDAQYAQLQAWATSLAVQERLRYAAKMWPKVDEFSAALDIVRA